MNRRSNIRYWKELFTLQSSKMSSYLSLNESLATLEHREGPMELDVCPTEWDTD
jgi:hypothetical protein